MHLDNSFDLDWIDRDPYDFLRRIRDDGSRGDFLPLAEVIDRGLEQVPAFEPLAGQSDWPGAGVQLTLFNQAVSSRPLWRPNDAMREVHRRMTKVMDLRGTGGPGYRRPLSRYVLGKGRYVYYIDLRNAFGSVELGCMAKLLIRNDGVSGVWGNPVQLKDMLRRYFFTPDGGLVQGGPASPYLFGLYAHHLLDLRFYHSNRFGWKRPEDVGKPTWADRNDLTYGRFVDDLVFVSRQPIGKRKRANINRIIREAGFEAHTGKTHLYDLARAPIVINGIGLRQASRGVRMYLPRRSLSKIEGLIHRASTKGDVSPDLVHGMMGWFYSATERDGRRLNATERRVLAAYARYRESLKAAKASRADIPC